MKKLQSCKTQENCWKKNLNAPQRYGKQFVTNNIDLPLMFVRLTNIRALRLRNTDWKSALTETIQLNHTNHTDRELNELKIEPTTEKVNVIAK